MTKDKRRHNRTKKKNNQQPSGNLLPSGEPIALDNVKVHSTILESIAETIVYGEDKNIYHDVDAYARSQSEARELERYHQGLQNQAVEQVKALDQLDAPRIRGGGSPSPNKDDGTSDTKNQDTQTPSNKDTVGQKDAVPPNLDAAPAADPNQSKKASTEGKPKPSPTKVTPKKGLSTPGRLERNPLRYEPVQPSSLDITGTDITQGVNDAFKRAVDALDKALNDSLDESKSNTSHAKKDSPIDDSAPIDSGEFSFKSPSPSTHGEADSSYRPEDSGQVDTDHENVPRDRPNTRRSTAAHRDQRSDPSDPNNSPGPSKDTSSNHDDDDDIPATPHDAESCSVRIVMIVHQVLRDCNVTSAVPTGFLLEALRRAGISVWKDVNICGMGTIETYKESNTVHSLSNTLMEWVGEDNPEWYIPYSVTALRSCHVIAALTVITRELGTLWWDHLATFGAQCNNPEALSQYIDTRNEYTVTGNVLNSIKELADSLRTQVLTSTQCQDFVTTLLTEDTEDDLVSNQLALLKAIHES